MRPAPYAKSFYTRRRLHHSEPRDDRKPMSSEQGLPRRFPSTDELVVIARRILGRAQAQEARIAIVGGLAMQMYGSPRLTKDVDVIADRPARLEPDLPVIRELSFGGVEMQSAEQIPVDWIVRRDEYSGLYEEALDCAAAGPHGLPVVRPEHLADMKFATLRARDYEDLMFLLGEPGLVDVEAARQLVYRRMGGRFARDQFDSAIEEARWRAERGGD